MTRRVGLLVNPTAGKGRARLLAGEVASLLAGHGLEVAQLRADDGTGARDLAAKAVAEGLDALVALGGDGLVHLALQAVAGTPVPLGVIPAGTGDDIARLVGVPRRDPRAAAEIVAAGRTRAIDVGRIEAADGNADWFLTIAACGFDSAVNERANAMSWPKGDRRYDLAMLLELPRSRPRSFRVEVDRTAVTVDAWLVAVGNGAIYGGGMKMCPAATVDDGLLDVTLVGAMSRPALLRLFPRVYSGRHVEHPEVRVLRGRSVVLSSPAVVAYTDGERVGPLPCEITCVPRAVTVLAP